MNTKNLGTIGEIKCLSDFINEGFNCSIPYGDNGPYDLIVDINKKLYKVQIKTSNSFRKEDIIEFNLKKTFYSGEKYINNRYEKDDFDILYLYNIKYNESYLFFIDELLKNEKVISQINIHLILENTIISKDPKIRYNKDNLFKDKIKKII